MAILVDREQASVIAFLHGILPEHPMYYAAIPEGFRRPCLYIPAADLETYTDTYASFRMVRTLYVHLFGLSIAEAQSDALRAVYAIAQNEFQVPVLNKDSSPEGHWLDIRPPMSRRLDDPDGASLVTVTWESRERYPREEPDYFMSFDIEPYLLPASEHTPRGPYSWGGEDEDGEEADRGSGCCCCREDGTAAGVRD